MGMDRITAKAAIREVMRLRGWSQEKLATESGMKSQANVTGVLNRGTSLRVDVLCRLVEAMGCEVVIRDKMGSKNEWTVHDDKPGETE